MIDKQEKIIKVFGYRRILKRCWWDSVHTKECDIFEIIYQSDHFQYYILKLSNDFGSCPSWYTCASWGEIKNIKIPLWDSYWELHFIPKKEFSGKEQYISMTEKEFNNSFSISTNWNDYYYPDWYAYIKKQFENLFQKTARYKEKRQVYIITWDKWKWKSYIARLTWLSIFETDWYKPSEIKWLKEIQNDIIIIWNKHKINIQDIEDKIVEAEIIKIHFS